MDNWTKAHIENQRVSRERGKRGPRSETMKVHQSNHTVSWKVYGKGVANHEFHASVSADGTPHIAFIASETLLARENYDAKRDVDKTVFGSLYGPAALELFEMLREVFEPVEPKNDPR